MAKAYTTTLLKENWSTFQLGQISRDSTARGEYMSMVVPANPNGWYHNCNARGGKDRNHSPFTVKKKGAGRVIELPDYAWTWRPTVILTQGEKPWQDYVVAAPVTVKSNWPTGIAARYQSSRDFYAAMFESGVFKLVRSLEGTITVLASTAFKTPKTPIKVSLTLEGATLTAKADRVTLTATDGCFTAGGIGLWAVGPATFGDISVKTTKAEADRITREQKRAAAAVVKKRKALSAMELVADIDVTGHAIGRQIRFADLTGDGREDILFAVPTYQMGRTWKYGKMARLSALTLTGDVLWERGKIQKDSDDATRDMPVQAADRGKGMEIVAAFGSSLEILDPKTGKAKKKTVTPKPPKMDPLWDEVSQFWGDGHFDDLPRLLPDSIRLCNFTGQAPYGDILIKDRYHNAWALDGRNFKVLWHHCCNTGHYPYTCDITGDGRDDILLGYSRLDSKGKLMSRLFLGDHPDACFSYVDADGVRHNLHPCGEAGFIDEYSDGRMAEVHLGHVQHTSVANFAQDRPDLERIIVTYHGDEGIIVLMDSDNRILRKAERYAAGSVCQPVNWTGDGRELIAFSPRHGDGGLWDENFDLVVPFPNDDRPGKYMEVHDMFGWGFDQLVVWNEQRLHIYAPKDRPKASRKRYTPVRPGPNLSNYQVNYSIPKWT